MTEATEMTGIARRRFSGTALRGLSVLAGAALAELSGPANAACLAADSLPQLLPCAKHVIYLHMIGAPSQLDLFDEKPELRRRHNQPCPESVTRGRNFAFIGKTSALAGSPGDFSGTGHRDRCFLNCCRNLRGRPMNWPSSDHSTLTKSIMPRPR
jgi:hypothetical protein